MITLLFKLNIYDMQPLSLDEWIKQRICRCIACIIVITGVIFFCPGFESSAHGANVKADETFAPDFVLRDLSGTNSGLKDFQGKIILLNFMTTWCPECLASIPYLKSIYTKYYKKGLIILNVNIQEREGKVAAYSKKHSLPYPTVLDEEGTIAKSYGVVGVPVKVLIDRDGRIICWNCRFLDELLDKKLK